MLESIWIENISWEKRIHDIQITQLLIFFFCFSSKFDKFFHVEAIWLLVMMRNSARNKTKHLKCLFVLGVA